jgi:hypothetical protein
MSWGFRHLKDRCSDFVSAKQVSMNKKHVLYENGLYPWKQGRLKVVAVVDILLSGLLFFIMILQHSDALVSVTVEIGLLHSQPFMNCHFHLMIFVWSRRPPRCCFIAQPNYQSLDVILRYDSATPHAHVGHELLVASLGTCASSTLSLKHTLGRLPILHWGSGNGCSWVVANAVCRLLPWLNF